MDVVGALIAGSDMSGRGSVVGVDSGRLAITDTARGSNVGAAAGASVSEPLTCPATEPLGAPEVSTTRVPPPLCTRSMMPEPTFQIVRSETTPAWIRSEMSTHCARRLRRPNRLRQRGSMRRR
jgi:hypothetical protein